MGKILENQRVSEDFYLMKVEEENQATMGQFYMLRAWDKYPVLSRPISVCLLYTSITAQKCRAD